MFDFFANPTRFVKLARAILPWAKAVAFIGFGLGLYWGLITSPADYQQGDTVRIMYIHVPVAWLASSSYFRWRYQACSILCGNTRLLILAREPLRLLALSLRG